MTPNHGNAAWHSTKARLTQERASFPGDPKTMPKKLTIAQIEEEPSLFQPRHDTSGTAKSAAHIETLTKALSGAGAGNLGAVTVWWTGKRYVLVDGHHRMAAYRAGSGTARGVKRGGAEKISVPVLCLTGPLNEAVEASLQGNSRDKLPMSLKEKVEGAWRMVCDGDDSFSKAQIARMSGSSTSTVGRMREVRRKLIDVEGIKAERVAGLPWEDAVRRAAGETDGTDYENEAAVEAMVQERSRLLSHTFKDALTTSPEVTARALQRYSPSLVLSLLEYWIGSSEELMGHARTVLAELEQDEGFVDDDGGCGDF